MTKTAKLLVQGDYPLIASPTLAQAYGVASAVFLQKLHYCLQSSDAKYIQQQKYFYHTYEQWADTLGVYSVSTIKRIVGKLKKAGVIMVKKLAQNKWLQTNFYTINYRKLRALLKGTTEQVEAEVLDQSSAKSVNSASPNAAKRTHSTLTLSVTAPPTRIKPKSSSIEGLAYPLNPTAQAADLKAMSPEKRGLYHQLLKLKVDIHYDDVRLDEWIKKRNFIIHKVAYLKDQLGHLKMFWHSPEQLGLDSQ